jgi:hypothetical protein
MKLHTKGWAVMAAVALVASAASSALAIESFQERFEQADHHTGPGDRARSVR